MSWALGRSGSTGGVRVTFGLPGSGPPPSHEEDPTVEQLEHDRRTAQLVEHPSIEHAYVPVTTAFDICHDQRVSERRRLEPFHDRTVANDGGITILPDPRLAPSLRDASRRTTSRTAGTPTGQAAAIAQNKPERSPIDSRDCDQVSSLATVPSQHV